MDGSKNNAAKTTTLFLLFFVITTFFGIPQNPAPNNNPKVTRVIVLNADSVELEQNNNPDIYVLRGNVIFRHDSIFMYCDSAYFKNKSNSLEAFNNIRIVQGDTLFIFGDFLDYYGNTQLAKIRENVKMENKDVTLFTDSFDFDRIKNLGYYFNGGMLIDSINELTSVYGQYSPDTKTAFFKNQVRLVNPQFILTSDSLIYNTETKIATIITSTVIEADSGFVYSDSGWYNTVTEESMLYNRSIVVSKDKSKTITADSIAYYRAKSFIEAFGNMILNDTVRKVIITGEYGFYDEYSKYAFVTDSAQMIEYSQRDSCFIHADTIQMVTIDSIQEIRAYYGVRFYRTDIQGVCDSALYNSSDSVLRLLKNPVLWNDTYQLSGDTIVILFNDSTIEQLNVLNYSFAMQLIDSTYYHQLKGRNLTCYFDAGEVYKMFLEGNGEAIYYNLDAVDAAPLQLSKSAASLITFDIKQRKIYRIKLQPESTMDIIPIPDLTPDTKFLKDFVDYHYIRPKSKEDIFIKTEMKTEDIPPPRRVRSRTQQE